MSQHENAEIIRKIKKVHENFVIGIGAGIGIILMLYFFSFAQFIDRVKPGLITFQIITTIIFVICLIFIKRVATFFTRLKLKRKPAFQTMMSKLSDSDFEKDEQTLVRHYTGEHDHS